MKKLKPVSVKQMIIDTLSEEIVTGKITPGNVLNERELSETLGVSRTPVREALQFLAAEGFITGSERKSWRVTIPDVKTIKDVFGFRTIIELAGLEALFKPENASAREQASKLFENITLESIKYTREEYLEKDRQLHNIMVMALENGQITNTYQKLSLWIEWVRHLLPVEVITQSGLREHKILCAAIMEHDLEKAKRALEEHIRRAKQDFVDLMEKSEYQNHPV